MRYNLHIEKYQSKDVGGIRKEQFREYSENTEYKNAVDNERTHMNTYEALSENGDDWFAKIEEAKQSTQEQTGHAVRKDAVVLCSAVESVPSSWSEEDCKQYFEDKSAWLRDYMYDGHIDEGCMLSCCVHLDETTPHATYTFIPEKDGRLQAKNIVNKSFLSQLQSDSQEFTMAWIEERNEGRSQTLEQLDPTVSEGRQHMTEQRYKAEKLNEHVMQLSQQQEDLTQQISDAQDRLSDINEQTEKTSDRLTEVNTKLENAEAKTADLDRREQQVTAAEDRIARLTESPDIQSYDEVKTENQSLKEELSMKDRIISGLQDRIQSLEDTVEYWKDKFMETAKALGSRILDRLGIDHSESVQQYPSKDMAAAFKEETDDVSKIDPSEYRVIPDQEHKGQYRIAVKDKDGYQTVADGFESREAADQQRRQMSSLSDVMNDTEKEKSEEKMKA
ncbi:MAG: plasmid recombination protein [Lactimicrobium massiliense]|nr:plasmid recombination protein [Lactimicrobium massiliense]MDD6727588.1 plasmid recombination protein [Lactimicrobium massiliense]